MVLPFADDGAVILEESDMGIDVDFGALSAEEIHDLVVRAMDELGNNDVIDIVAEWANGDDAVRAELQQRLEGGP